MKNQSLAIWVDARPLYCAKEHHAKSVENQKLYTGFAVFNGEIPTVVFNDITGKAMPVENNRGHAYACRKRLMYRTNKKKFVARGTV